MYYTGEITIDSGLCFMSTIFIPGPLSGQCSVKADYLVGYNMDSLQFVYLQ